jgi:trans-2,3-dihydro-3-hydroxyanthranilate isomerase
VLPYTVIDVFTDRPLEGNQLGVFAEARSLSPEQMQRLAREMNFAESVFVLPPRQGGDAWIRIFTPKQELPFAGHPVLGAAFVVGEPLGASSVRLETGSGVVALELRREGSRVVYGSMQQPLPTVAIFDRQAELLAALRVPRSRLPIEVYRNGPSHVFVALESEDAVAAVRPDLTGLAALGEIGVSTFAGARRSWKTRMFAPGLGVAEDPATGSAAGPLAVHLARNGAIEFGEQIEIRQGAEIGRPSLLYARADGSRDAIERVEVGGSAVVVARGEFHRY